MYSGILMTTSGMYKIHQEQQHQQQQMRDKNTVVPPGFAPILPKFGENPYEYFYGQPQSSIHPAYLEHVSVNHTLNDMYKNYQQQQPRDKNTIVPPGFAPILFGENPYENFHGQLQSSIHPTYLEHVSVKHTLNQGFGVENHQMMNNTPLYPQGFLYEYSMQQHAMNNSSATQQTNAPQVERSSHENDLEVEVESPNALEVEVESPNSPKSKPRLRWTPELHERFTRAAEELGGYFEARPKAILQKMNVRGITREQLKSHLQKVRKSIIHTSSSSDGQARGRPDFEYDIEGHGRLQMSCKCLNNYCEYRIASVNEHLANNVKFDSKDFCSSKSSRTSTYHQIFRNATYDSDAHDMKFKDVVFGWIIYIF
ncbi:hypothetical protein ACET3Z_006074 [Daucus carota]